MFYEYNVIIPENTLTSGELKQALRLSRGVITKIEMVFPHGCAGLAGIRLFRDNLQVIPLNYPGWVDADGETVTINSEIDLSVNPHELTAYAYNLDDTYPHTIRVRVELTQAAEEFSVETPQAASDRLKAQIGV